MTDEDVSMSGLPPVKRQPPTHRLQRPRGARNEVKKQATGEEEAKAAAKDQRRQMQQTHQSATTETFHTLVYLFQADTHLVLTSESLNRKSDTSKFVPISSQTSYLLPGIYRSERQQARPPLDSSIHIQTKI